MSRLVPSRLLNHVVASFSLLLSKYNQEVFVSSSCARHNYLICSFPTPVTFLFSIKTTNFCKYWKNYRYFKSQLQRFSPFTEKKSFQEVLTEVRRARDGTLTQMDLRQIFHMATRSLLIVIIRFIGSCTYVFAFTTVPRIIINLQTSENIFFLSLLTQKVVVDWYSYTRRHRL